MERPCAWNSYDTDSLACLEALNERYRRFISENKTERECVAAAVKMAKDAGYKDLAEAVAAGQPVAAGDKFYVNTRGKALTLFCLGTEPLESGLNILGAHVDSPRLDIKQNPVYEKADLAFMDTHYLSLIHI